MTMEKFKGSTLEEATDFFMHAISPEGNAPWEPALRNNVMTRLLSASGIGVSSSLV